MDIWADAIPPGWLVPPGGGLNFSISRSKLSIDVRYTHDLNEFVDEPVPNGTNIEDNGVAPDWKHSNISIMLGFYF